LDTLTVYVVGGSGKNLPVEVAAAAAVQIPEAETCRGWSLEVAGEEAMARNNSVVEAVG